MRITSKGQVTIPPHIREAAGSLPETEVDFVLKNGEVRPVKAKRAKKHSRGARMVERMRRAKTLGMRTDEIMAMTRGWGEDDPGFH